MGNTSGSLGLQRTASSERSPERHSQQRPGAAEAAR